MFHEATRSAPSEPGDNVVAGVVVAGVAATVAPGVAATAAAGAKATTAASHPAASRLRARIVDIGDIFLPRMAIRARGRSVSSRSEGGDPPGDIMATNLWTDVEALDRLARSARAAEGRRGGPVFPGGRGGVEAPPILPRFHGDGFAVAASERPARLVSGDLVDAFPLSDREIAVVIGDVSGKGTPAGVMAAFVRSIVRHVAPLGASPGDTLER